MHRKSRKTDWAGNKVSRDMCQDPSCSSKMKNRAAAWGERERLLVLGSEWYIYSYIKVLSGSIGLKKIRKTDGRLAWQPSAGDLQVMNKAEVFR